MQLVLHTRRISRLYPLLWRRSDAAAAARGSSAAGGGAALNQFPAVVDGLVRLALVNFDTDAAAALYNITV